jgi:hypothetical protein
VVLDEFPYLADADAALPSVVQKFWDSGAPAAGNLKLLLCGSTISQMQELLAERNPLYGRKTLSLDLAPLSFREGGAVRAELHGGAEADDFWDPRRDTVLSAVRKSRTAPPGQHHSAAPHPDGKSC